MFKLHHTIFLIFAGSILAGFQNSQVTAQVVAGSGWSEPFNLSQSSSTSSSPQIVADPYGFVHAFWSEDLNGGPHPEGVAPTDGNAIMYRRLNLKEGVWTEPVDIVYGGDRSQVGVPSAVVDENGVLHLLWIQNNALLYSYAPAWEAHLVRAWSVPISLAEGGIYRIKLLDLGENRLTIYSVTSGDSPGLFSIVVAEDLSSTPKLIWEAPRGYLPQDISAVADGEGRIHTVWSVSQFQSPAALEVRYSYSMDGGASWFESRLVTEQNSEENSLQFAVPWVYSRGYEEIHLQWAQGIRPYRKHQYSVDGGRTWSDPRQIWPDLLSQTNSEAVGTDSDGNLYWVDVLRYPNGAYLISWEGNRWGRPELFYIIQKDATEGLRDRIHVHELHMGISLGNRLHVVFQDQARAEIWYMSTTLGASEVEIKPIPSPTEAPLSVFENEGRSPSQPSENTQPVLLTPQPTLDLNDTTSTPGFILLAGIVPVALLVTLTMFIRGKK